MLQMKIQMIRDFTKPAKFPAGETHLVSNEAIQMHGGIGVTDEYDIGFIQKSARTDL